MTAQMMFATRRRQKTYNWTTLRHVEGDPKEQS